MSVLKFVLSPFVVIVFLLAAVYFFPFGGMNWGSLQYRQDETVVVTGYADSNKQNQIATFSAGVSSVKDKKEDAVSEVNLKVDALIKSVKTFGIPAEDIKTQNISVYQDEESYYDDSNGTSVQKRRPGQWRVSNSIDVTLRDIERSSSLASLLTSSGATNIYGPSFRVDDTKQAQIDLIEEAIEDARKKAMVMAQKSGRKLGKVINISEGGSSYPYSNKMFMMDGIGGGGGSAVEPGTSLVSQMVTVTFELR